ncbi:hypothetical protein [Pantoea stewartii]|uniref:hypothetical protein n=1 Tax=Pantoea stewartii TaxID=66269 RepID=UPI00345C4682
MKILIVRLLTFLLTLLVLGINLSVIAFMLHKGVGPSGGMTWEIWQLLALSALVTLFIQAVNPGGNVLVYPIILGLGAWLMVPAGWILEVVPAGQLQVTSKAFLYYGPGAGILSGFFAAVVVFLIDVRPRY